MAGNRIWVGNFHAIGGHQRMTIVTCIVYGDMVARGSFKRVLKVCWLFATVFSPLIRKSISGKPPTTVTLPRRRCWLKKGAHCFGQNCFKRSMYPHITCDNMFVWVYKFALENDVTGVQMTLWWTRKTMEFLFCILHIYMVCVYDLPFTRVYTVCSF